AAAPPRSELSVSNLPAVHVNQLPVAPSGRASSSPPTSPAAPFLGTLPALPAPSAGTVWVDDDYCSGCPNDGHALGADAFTTFQGALDRHPPAGTMVLVSPGTYGPFTISTSNLEVRGVNPDAVFVDARTSTGGMGAFGVRVS